MRSSRVLRINLTLRICSLPRTQEEAGPPRGVVKPQKKCESLRSKRHLLSERTALSRMIPPCRPKGDARDLIEIVLSNHRSVGHIRRSDRRHSALPGHDETAGREP